VTMKRPRTLTLEEALQFINDDELVEATPENIRIRKTVLEKNAREKEAKRIKQLMQEDE
ncbi:hypothetical protein WL503_11815, partial [Staphylococcus hominis]